MPLDDTDNPLAIEIKQEMAAAYFAACKKMVNSLEALKTCDHTLGLATPDVKQARRRADLLDHAVERVYFVMIQREAMKLPSYQEFFEAYEIPDEVRTRLGPRRVK